MEFAVEMPSCGMICMPSLMKIGLATHKSLIRGNTHADIHKMMS
jgi:hypothetical protein